MISQEYTEWHRLHHPNILPLVGICYLAGDEFARFISAWQENGRILDVLQDNSDADLLQIVCLSNYEMVYSLIRSSCRKLARPLIIYIVIILSMGT